MEKTGKSQPEIDKERIDAAQKRYWAALHAMQTGVAVLMERSEEERKSTEPKHLRTGINSALVDSSALATLLINKGLITDAEYAEALADAAEAERDRYQAAVNAFFGSESRIKLV